MSHFSAVSAALAMAGILCLPSVSSAERPAKPSQAPSSRLVTRASLTAMPFPSGQTPSATEAQFVALLNQERTRRGQRPLVWEPSLCVTARRHSEEMARLSYFDHRSPTPGFETPADRWEQVVQRTPDEYVIGENLFYGSSADARWGHTSLMESSAHRANMLNAGYTRVGVGVHVDRSGGMWVTQLFLS